MKHIVNCLLLTIYVPFKKTASLHEIKLFLICSIILLNFYRWKYDGPSDSFKALVDMAAVHSSCRLCIFLATRIREKEEKSFAPKRPCKCTRGSETVYHIYVRERGRFEMESVFLR